MSLDDPTQMAEPWAGHPLLDKIAELLEEIRRSHAECDRWKTLTAEWEACAWQWRLRAELFERRVAEEQAAAEAALARCEELELARLNQDKPA